MRRHLPVSAVVGGAMAVPLLIRNDLVLDLYAGVLILASVALALNLVVGMAGQVSLGHGALMGIGAFTTGILTTRFGVDGVSTFLAAAVVGAVFGAVFGIPSLRVRGQYLALVTIGAGFIFVRSVTESEFLGGHQGIVDIPYLQILGRTLEVKGQSIVSAALFSVALITSWVIVHSRAGRRLAALKDDETGAEMLGIHTTKLKIAIFVLSSSLAALGGAAYAHLEGFVAGDLFGLELSLLLLLTCLVGGLGRPLGPPVGAALLGAPFVVVPGISRYQLLVIGPIALVILFWMPDGICGRLRRGRRKFGVSSLDKLPPVPAEMVRFPGTSSGVLIAVDGVSKEFGGIKALTGVSLQIEKSQIHALIGPNGSGKSTLIDVITGVRKASGGRVEIGGLDIARHRPHSIYRLGVSRTFQSMVQFPSLTVLESAILGTSSDYRTSCGRAMALMRLFDLQVDPHGASHDLSYGQAKRLEMVRALVSGPRVLILDEPAAGMSPPEIDHLASVLQTLKSDGLTILIADHHMEFLMQIADVVTVLESGKVVASGPPSEIRSDREVIRAYLGER